MAMGQRQMRIDVGKYPIEFSHGIELSLLLGGEPRVLSAV
jgi:hypothetical protein